MKTLWRLFHSFLFFPILSYMKKIFLLCFLFLPYVFASSDAALDAARTLAEKGIIVNQSRSSAAMSVNHLSEAQEMSLYRLNSRLARQEAIKIALSLRGVHLPPSYYCRGYFLDIYEDWVCRVVEFASDHSIVSRSNSLFRPQDSLTLWESLKIIMVALEMPLSDLDPAIVPWSQPTWHKHIALTLRERWTSFLIYDTYGSRIVSFAGNDPLTAPIRTNMSHRMTRGEFFQLVTTFLDLKNNTQSCYNYRYSTCPSSCDAVCVSSSGYGPIGTADCEWVNSCVPKTTSQFAYCTAYNNGCNDCFVVNWQAACDKRACFTQNTPYCTACEYGYSLSNGRCIKTDIASCVREGEYAGGGYVMYPENNSQYQCCSWLTRVQRDNRLPDAWYICIRANDGYCDTRYENENNSSDCRNNTGFDSSLCQSYYDGCNTCSRSSNGQVICTMMACTAIVRPSYCTTYIPYTPTSQPTDSLFLGKVLQEIRNYTSDLSCVNSAQCQWKSMGNMPCWGPSVFVSYSAKNIDSWLLDRKANDYTTMQTLFNRTYPVFGICAVLNQPAPLSCISGTCR